MIQFHGTIDFELKIDENLHVRFECIKTIPDFTVKFDIKQQKKPPEDNLFLLTMANSLLNLHFLPSFRSHNPELDKVRINSHTQLHFIYSTF